MQRAGMSVSKQPKNRQLQMQGNSPLPGSEGYGNTGNLLGVSLTRMMELDVTFVHTTGTEGRTQGAHEKAGKSFRIREATKRKQHVSAPKKVSEEGKRAASVQHAAPQSMPMLHQPAMGMASVSTLQVQGHHNAAPQRMERTPLQPLQPCIPGATHPTNTAPFAAYNALADGQTGWGSMCRMPGISMGFAGLHDVHNTTLPTAQPQVFDTRTVPPTIPWPTIGGARNVGTAHGGFLHAQRHGALSSAL